MELGTKEICFIYEPNELIFYILVFASLRSEDW